MIAGLFIAVLLIGYLLGSLPFGVIIGRLLGKTDVRNIGSGKTGMTNVMRVTGKKGAALSLICDLGKGALSVYLSWLIFNSVDISGYPAMMIYFAQVVAALGAIAGHSWSIFLKFKGGRGVNTFLGGLMAMFWPAAIAGGLIVIIIGLITRYVSLGSITGAVVSFVMLIILYYLDIEILNLYPHFAYVVYTMIGAIFIYTMHRDNIRRLVTGRERKLGEKTGTENTPATDSRNP
jgi:glycerol-3-phosphate acyltransferase PlsY